MHRDAGARARVHRLTALLAVLEVVFLTSSLLLTPALVIAQDTEADASAQPAAEPTAPAEEPAPAPEALAEAPEPAQEAPAEPPKAEPEPQAAPALESAPEPEAEEPKAEEAEEPKEQKPDRPDPEAPAEPKADPKPEEPRAEEPAPEVALVEPERRLVIDSEPRKLDLLVGDTVRLSAWLCPVGEAPLGPDEAPATADDACAPATDAAWSVDPAGVATLGKDEAAKVRLTVYAPIAEAKVTAQLGEMRATREVSVTPGPEAEGTRGSEREPGREERPTVEERPTAEEGQLVPESDGSGADEGADADDQQAVADETAESLAAAVETETAIDPSSAAMPYDLIEPAANSFSVTPVAQTVPAGSTNSFAWVFTATNSGNVTTLSFAIPSAWTVPSTIAGAAGQVTVTAGTCAASLYSVVGQIVTIDQGPGNTTCGNATTFTLRYLQATAPTPASLPQTYTFMNNRGVDPTVTVTATSADLSVTKSDSPDPVNAGANLTYTLTVSNAGPSAAQGVSLADTLSTDLASATYCIGVACDPATGSAWSSPLSLGTLAAHTSTIVRIRAQVGASVAAGTVISNTATVSSTTSDPNTGDNSATATTSVIRGATVSARKLTTPANLPVSFIFDLRQSSPTGAVVQTVSDSAADATATPFANEIPAGTYAVTEQTNGGFIPGNGTCVRPTVPGDTPVSADALVVGPGEAWECTFTNIQKGTIEIVKQTNQAGATTAQQFTFTRPAGLGGGTFDLGKDEQQQFLQVTPGAYAFAEQVPAGWALTNLACTESGGTNTTPTTPPVVTDGVVIPPGVTVNVDPGETVRCIFTNTELGSITIEKIARPANTGTTFSYTSATLGPFSLVNDTDGTDTELFSDLLPGTYEVTETDDDPAWVLTGLTCTTGGSGSTATRTATVVLTAGADVTCTYTNTQQASIQIAKVTQRPGTPDTTTGFGFTGAIAPTLTGGQSSTPLTVAPDPTVPYVVTETVPTNWSLTSVACIDKATGQATPNAVGSVGGRTATFDSDPGQNLLCTFTNSQGAVLVTKTTNPAGSATTFPFLVSGPPGSVTAPNGAPVSSRTFDLADGGSELVYVRPGATYTVAESVPAGWKITTNTCSGQNPPPAAGTASPGVNATVTCAYTNTQLGGVTVTKSVTGARTGEAWAFDFTISPAPPAPQTATIRVTGTGTGTGTATWTDLDPDTTYTITETLVPGTSTFLAGQIACGGSPVPGTAGIQVQPTPGSTVTPVACTATNVRTGTLTVVKELVDGRVVTAGDTFDLTVTGGPAAVNQAVTGLGDGGSQTIVDLQPSAFQTSTGALDGTPVPYLVRESDPTDPRYRLVGIECLAGTTVKYVNIGGPFLDPSTVAASVDLLAGEDVVCTFTNDFADLSITKTDSLDPVVPGLGGLTYTLTVTNNGTGRPSTAATVYDSLAGFPAGVVFTAPAPAGCSYDAAARLATCTVAVDLLDAGESATVTLPVTVPADVSVAPAGSTFDNRASVDVPEDPCGGTCTPPPSCPPPSLWGNNGVCEPTTLTPVADLGIEKLAEGPSGTTPNPADTPETAEPVVPGDRVTFTIRITNNGPSLAQGVVITDPLNAELSAPELVSATGGAVCDFVPGNPPALVTPVSCTWQSLAVGATAEVVLTAVVADPISATAPFANTATVTGATPEPSPDPTPNSDPAYVTTGADFRVTKSDGVDTVIAGDGVTRTFTISVTNDGPSTATGMTLTDTWPAGYTLGTITSSSGTCQSQPSPLPVVISCPLGDIAAGGSATVSIEYSVPASTPDGPQTNQATVASRIDDPNATNNTASDTNTVTTSADLSVTKSVTPAETVSGGSVAYTLTLTNAGPSDATSVTLTDAFPANLQGITVVDDGPYSCAPVAGSTLTCTIDSHPVGVSAVISVTATVVPGTYPDSTTVSNTATVSSQTTDPNPADNTATATFKIRSNPAISVTKTATPSTVPEPGGNVSFAVSVTNTGDVAVSLASLVDDVYGDLNGTGTCALPQPLAPGKSYACSFTTFVGGVGGTVETDVVTARAATSEGRQASASDDATVTITDIAPAIAVTKTASVTRLEEPGGDVTFTVTIRNLVPESLGIVALSDDLLGDLDDPRNPKLKDNSCANSVGDLIAAGATFECRFTALVIGQAGDRHVNTVTVSVTDDEEALLNGEIRQSAVTVISATAQAFIRIVPVRGGGAGDDDTGGGGGGSGDKQPSTDTLTAADGVSAAPGPVEGSMGWILTILAAAMLIVSGAWVFRRRRHART